MRILLLTQLFQPEPNHLKGLTFAKALIRKGYEVEVLTGFPNYPGGKLYPGYKIRLYQKETIEGVPITRVAMYPSHNKSGFRRFLCYVSFALAASVLGLFILRRPDLIHVYQGPATLTLPAIVMRAFWKTPFVLDVQDIWPESVTDSGMLGFKFLEPLLNWYCHFNHKCADKIIVLSNGYKNLLVTRKVAPEKIEVIYNWCDETQILNKPIDEGQPKIRGLAGHFNVVYAGTMGTIQALDSVVQAAALLQDDNPNVQFVFIGGGVDVENLKKLAANKNLDNVLFVPKQPIEKIKPLLDSADVLLIHLKATPLGEIGIPQKTQAYMAAGKPILMALKGEAADLVTQADSGIVCTPGAPQDIALSVKRLLALTPTARRKMGDNGLKFYKDVMSFKHGLVKMQAIFKEAVSG